MNKQPIGVFDSGVGGTSIWKEIHNLLPNENTIYLADSKNAPYGPKGKDAIVELSIKNTDYLISNDYSNNKCHRLPKTNIPDSFYWY